MAGDTTVMVQSDSGMAGMEGMTPAQDPDHEFLRMMVNHHAGLVALAAEAVTRASDDSVRTAANMLQQKQQAEQDSMSAMIQRMYNEQPHVMPMPKNMAQVDSLKQTTGTAADQYFLRTVIAHHQEGIPMIDQFLPRSTKPEVRQMAEMMKADQQAEITELQGKLSSL